jgi:hypothetical protein
MTDWLFKRTEVPCVNGVGKEENTHPVDASPKVEDVISEVLKIMKVNIKAIEYLY